ncbi:MAG TPA: hypothetical protein VH079_17260 [Terriglobales bacterium]|jgi:hypothetical protein|nr:hypothetical protein [Terriglobales bacterium]
MGKFCVSCGSSLNGGMFCARCGAASGEAAAPLVQPPVVAAVQTTPVSAATTPAKSNLLIKVLVAFGIFIVVVGALAVGGVYYVAHRVSQKVHQLASELPNSTESSSNNSAASSKIAAGSSQDPCRLLSKEDVGRAAGVKVVRTESTGDSCSYLAVGDAADMTSRHMSAMMASKGADSQQQKMIQQFAGGLFKASEKDGKSDIDSNGNVPVFSFSLEKQAADGEMGLNRTVLAGMPGGHIISGIGDEAFDAGDSMIMVRKGDMLIRIMYMTCPCNTDAVKPLARKLADAL